MDDTTETGMSIEDRVTWTAQALALFGHHQRNAEFLDGRTVRDGLIDIQGVLIGATEPFDAADRWKVEE